jgi:hypothetical protein
VVRAYIDTPDDWILPKKSSGYSKSICAFPEPPRLVLVRNHDTNYVAATEVVRHKQNPLLHICDLYDNALCLRVLWILHHSDVQFLLAFTECDVCCAITRGDPKYV